MSGRPAGGARAERGHPPLVGGSLARASSATAHRRGLLPQCGQPRPSLRQATRRHAPPVAAPAQAAGRSSRAEQSCRRGKTRRLSGRTTQTRIVLQLLAAVDAHLRSR
jgi:hypothetical protein